MCDMRSTTARPAWRRNRRVAFSRFGHGLASRVNLAGVCVGDGQPVECMVPGLVQLFRDQQATRRVVNGSSVGRKGRRVTVLLAVRHSQVAVLHVVVHTIGGRSLLADNP